MPPVTMAPLMSSTTFACSLNAASRLSPDGAPATVAGGFSLTVGPPCDAVEQGPCPLPSSPKKWPDLEQLQRRRELDTTQESPRCPRRAQSFREVGTVRFDGR